jgi:hypothetical protein
MGPEGRSMTVKRSLTGLAIAVAMLLAAATPAAAYDSNYFEMLRERDADRAVVVGLSFRLGEKREHEAPRISFGFSDTRADKRDLIDISAYRFAPVDSVPAPIAFTDEDVRTAAVPEPASAWDKAVQAAAAPVPKLERAAPKRAKPQRAAAQLVLAAAPEDEGGVQRAVLIVDNPHAMTRDHPPTDI